MTFWLSALGALFGAMLGHVFGALIGGMVGFGVAKMLKSDDAPADRAKATGGAPDTPESTLESKAQLRKLERRVQQLEQTVTSLQATVDHLTQAGPSSVAAQPATPNPPAAASPPPAARYTAALAVAPPATALPLPEPEPEPKPHPLPEGDAPGLAPLSDAELSAQALQAPHAEWADTHPGPLPLAASSAMAAQAAAPAEPAPALTPPPSPAIDTAINTGHSTDIDTDGATDSRPAPAPAAPAAPAPMALDPAILAQNWPDADVRGGRETSQSLSGPRDLKDFVPERLRPLVFGGNTIVKVGVLILFLGLSFLLKYMAEQITVPIEMRYAGVALLGAGLLGLGWRLRNRVDASGAAGYGLILQGAGVGIFYLTTLAAMKLHPLLPVPAGFGLMVLVTALASVLAVAQNAPWLAMVASVAGFATPVLVSTGGGNHIALFSYMAILDMGIVAMAWFRAWRPLNLIGFIGTFSLAGAWASSRYSPAFYPEVQGFLLLFFLMFTAIGVLFARRALALGDEGDAGATLGHRAAQALRQVGRVDSSLVFGVPLAAYGLQYQMVRDDPWLPALSAMILGLFYVLLGGALWRGKHPRYALLAEAYVVVGALFGTLAIPLALEGEWTGATWAVEAAGMYWLGTRQHRGYTRAFALALLGCAALRMFTHLGWSDAPDQPFLTGSLLGMLMLAGSALSVGLVHRRAQLASAHLDTPLHSPGENQAAAASWWLAAGTLALLPWMLFMPIWASVCMALLALGCSLMAERIDLPALRVTAPVLHLAALGGFATTLHQHENQAMLANGLQGLSAAVLISACMLGSAWLGMRDTWRRATDPARAPAGPPSWPQGSSLGILAAVSLLHGALLFLMPLSQAVLVWPVAALCWLWGGLRLAHPALCWLWALWSGAAVLGFMAFGPAVWPTADLPLPQASGAWPLGGLAWWTPLLLTLCSGVAAAWLHRAAQRTEGWRMPWVTDGAVHLAMLMAVCWWWGQSLPPEIWRALLAHELTAWAPACMALWVTLSSVLAVGLGRWRQWPLMGQVAGLTLPMWVAALVIGPLSTGLPPSADLGWLAWPLACVWHLALLRLSARWWAHLPQAWMHVGGFWLFAFLASRQAQWATDQWAEHHTAWQALGWLAVPLMLTTAVCARRWREAWPLQQFGQSYRLAGALPLVLCLLGWLLWSLVHAGHAAPLPYVPLLNPLEIGQGLVMLTLLMWARSLPEDGQGMVPSRSLRAGTLGGIGLLLLTTMVLRACHHWAGVPWQAEALFASKLTQAALSVTWASVGVALMLTGHRRLHRKIWGMGAALLAIVVTKLFFVELADHGGLYRIISFIVVGLLLLVVGYFAPVPPSEDEQARVAPAGKDAAP